MYVTFSLLEFQAIAATEELSNSVRTFATASIAAEMLFLSIAEADVS